MCLSIVRIRNLRSWQTGLAHAVVSLVVAWEFPDPDAPDRSRTYPAYQWCSDSFLLTVEGKVKKSHDARYRCISTDSGALLVALRFCQRKTIIHVMCCQGARIRLGDTPFRSDTRSSDTAGWVTLDFAFTPAAHVTIR